MSDDLISQEEIDALLNGGVPAADSSAPAPDAAAPEEAPTDTPATNTAAPDASIGDILSDIEKDALGEIGNISMGSAATTLSVLLGHKVSITTPSVSVDTMSMIKDHYPMPYLIVELPCVVQRTEINLPYGIAQSITNIP